MIHKFAMTAILLASAALLAGCDAVPGTDAWCEKLTNTAKSDWSAEDAKIYAEECVVKPAKDAVDDTIDDVTN
ncbi:hypothetical protein JCM17846_24300 [Iodidimonas nitroreducens]|uniref:DUF3012 domain-containing protein n=1 Tax=Iodidimonas nitroreducens TaxID=1236968 RepID=A0A5A7N9H4_9PROT|nr:DUF3012 domain-containing protein [Iodidimonas nitroreducens]GAK34291.1 hypothetical protein AQ1_02189 [alpha proteobacterium Q-1]GER04748.1 hypothetical protein JCM17846_24300 [Iodidimonas nitroreducens]